MPHDRAYLALAIALVAVSLASSLAAAHFYQIWIDRIPEPRGSLADDGSTNMFSDPGFWNPWSGLSRVVLLNGTLALAS